MTILIVRFIMFAFVTLIGTASLFLTRDILTLKESFVFWGVGTLIVFVVMIPIAIISEIIAIKLGVNPLKEET